MATLNPEDTAAAPPAQAPSPTVAPASEQPPISAQSKGQAPTGATEAEIATLHDRISFLEQRVEHLETTVIGRIHMWLEKLRGHAAQSAESIGMPAHVVRDLRGE